MGLKEKKDLSHMDIEQEGKNKIIKKLSITWQNVKRNKMSYILITPYFILFTLFIVLPVIISIGISFTKFNMLQPMKFVGWDNYLRLFLEDDVFSVAIKNTIIFAVITGPISYLACFVFAWIINEMRPFARSLMTLIFYAPSISGNVYFIWQIFFSGDLYGFANGMLMKLGLIDIPIQWFKDERFILPILIIVQLWLSLGTGFLAFIAGLQTVDKSLYEAAAVDGIKNRWQELWYVTLPSMKPQLMFGAVMQITQSFAVSDISINLAGLPSINNAGSTVVTHLVDYGTIRFDMGYSSTIATVLFIIMITSNKVVQKLLKRIGE